MKYGMITLTVPEAKRLIAHGVCALPQVKRALTHGKVIIAGGTTNGYVAEELTGSSLNKALYTAGIICGGRCCVTAADKRLKPLVLHQGKISEASWTDALETLEPGDIFIKGANAVDLKGNIGILLGSPSGGTIGRAIGTLSARGVELVAPVGWEKLVPSVAAAAATLGVRKLDYSWGLPCGMQVVANATVVNETQAMQLVTGCTATVAAAGGVGDCQGAVTLAFSGNNEAFTSAVTLLEKIKGEQSLPCITRDCPCNNPCHHGKANSRK